MLKSTRLRIVGAASLGLGMSLIIVTPFVRWLNGDLTLDDFYFLGLGAMLVGINNNLQAFLTGGLTFQPVRPQNKENSNR